MNPILFVAAFLAVLGVIGLVWSMAVTAARADRRLEEYRADQRHDEETAGGR